MSFHQTFFDDSELDRLESSLTELPPRCPPSGINILIVGAGPAGLFAALECWRKGHDVRVIERSPRPTTAGDHFSIAPQIARHINTRWPGLAQQNEAIADDPWLSLHTITGETIKGPAPFSWKDDNDDEDGEDDPLLPTRFYRHHRAKFLRMLMVAVRKAGIVITYGQRVVDYYEDAARQVAGVRISSESGGGAGGETTATVEEEADLVIAADGVGTKSHGAVNGHDIRAEPSGYALYRACFPVERLAPYPALAHYMRPLDNGHPHLHVWAGRGVSVYFCRYPDLVAWAMQHKADETAGESWGTPVPVEKILQSAAALPDGDGGGRLPDLLQDLIRASPDDGVVDWKLLLRDPQPRVASGAGRVVQVGDSAHTFLPSSGDGANQGMEDAISLAACLHVGAKDKGNIEWAVRVHEKLRFERVACAQIVGFLRFKQTMQPPPPSSSSDDNDPYPASSSSAPPTSSSSSPPSSTTTTTTKPPTDLRSRLCRWQWSHDPEQYAYAQYGAALRHLQTGAPFCNTNIPRGYEYQPWTFGEVLALVAKGQFLELGGDWS